MLRLTCILGTDEPIYLHAFGGRPPEPGKLCEGENKVTFYLISYAAYHMLLTLTLTGGLCEVFVIILNFNLTPIKEIKIKKIPCLFQIWL